MRWLQFQTQISGKQSFIQSVMGNMELLRLYKKMSRQAWKIQTLSLLASISTVDLYSELDWTRPTSSSTKVTEDPHLSRDLS